MHRCSVTAHNSPIFPVLLSIGFRTCLLVRLVLRYFVRSFVRSFDSQGKKKGYQQTPHVGPFAGVEPWVYFNVGGDQVKRMLEEVRTIRTTCDAALEKKKDVAFVAFVRTGRRV